MRQTWNQAVQCLALPVRKILADHSPELFEACLPKFLEDEAQSEARARRESMWSCLEDLAVSGGTAKMPPADARIPRVRANIE